MDNGWFSTLGAMSSLSVCYCITTMVLMRALFRNLCKVFSSLRSTCTCFWLAERVTGINRQENSKETSHIRDLKWCKLNENPTLEHKNYSEHRFPLGNKRLRPNSTKNRFWTVIVSYHHKQKICFSFFLTK